jgi:LuxR family transcriptional regulator/LuxR family quorum-sensing system transcriptional regulator CciR
MRKIPVPDNYDELAKTFVEEIGQTENIEEMIEYTLNYFLASGVKMACYHHLPPIGADDYQPFIQVAARGFSKRLQDAYNKEKLYNIDPVVRKASKTTEPFWWSEVYLAENMNEEERAFLELVREETPGDGMTIPVFGPNGRNGYVGICFDRYNIELSELQISRLQSAAQIAHQRYCQFLNDRKKEDVDLSLRETEILSWIVRGKSNSVIADIIGISSNTVDTYLKRIYGKLGVSNRVTAALKGLSIGLVQ